MQKIPLLRTFTAGVIAICLSFHLTGCAVTPLNHVGAFSQASAELAKIRQMPMRMLTRLLSNEK